MESLDLGFVVLFVASFKGSSIEQRNGVGFVLKVAFFGLRFPSFGTFEWAYLLAFRLKHIFDVSNGAIVLHV